MSHKSGQLKHLERAIKLVNYEDGVQKYLLNKKYLGDLHIWTARQGQLNLVNHEVGVQNSLKFYYLPT